MNYHKGIILVINMRKFMKNFVNKKEKVLSKKKDYFLKIILGKKYKPNINN